MRHGDVLIWGLPFWSAALGIAVRRWWVLWLSAAFSVAWAAWASQQVKPNDFGWMSGDVEVTAAVGFVMGVLAAATGVCAADPGAGRSRVALGLGSDPGCAR